MRKIAVLMLLGMMATGTAVASAITVDGNLSDWGVTVDYTKVDRPNAAWAPTLGGVSWWAGDSTDVGGVASCVGPGYGGQNFDVEAAYITSQDDVLYAAFVSGFDRDGQYGWDTSVRYASGDLFFKVSGSSSWSFAICMYSHDGFVMGEAYIPNSPGSNWYTTPTDYPSSGPAQLSGPVSNFTVLAGVDYAYSQGTTANENELASTDPSTYYPNDHNIVEVSLDISDLRGAFPSIVSGSSVVMHYTESCGNDVFNLTGSIIYTPEPGTAALLALGMVGAYARWRRKGERSRPTNAA